MNIRTLECIVLALCFFFSQDIYTIEKLSFTKKPTTDAKLDEKLSEAQMITEKNKYTLSSLFDKQGDLVAFNDEGTELTSIGSAGTNDKGGDRIEVTRSRISGQKGILHTFEKVFYTPVTQRLSGDGSRCILGFMLCNSSGELLSTFPLHYQVIALNHDGTMFSSLISMVDGSKHIVLYNIGERQEIMLATNTSHNISPRTQIFSRDGKKFAYVSQSEVFLFDTKDGRLKYRTHLGPSIFINAVALNQDGSRIALSLNNKQIKKNELLLIHVATNNIQKLLEKHERLNNVGFFNQATHRLWFTSIANDNNNFLHFFDLDYRIITQTIQTSNNWNASIAISPDDTRIAIGNRDSIQLWKKSTQLQTPTPEKVHQQTHAPESKTEEQKKEMEEAQRKVPVTKSKTGLTPAVDPLD